MWMTYDTAIPRSTFLAQQIAFLVAGFVGFSVFFAPVVHGGGDADAARVRPSSAALARRGRREPGASIQILGRTVSGYLLVSVFFAYDVLLYLVMTKVFGWWSPAEALVHPDVLATYAPWLSAIANSFQAGFWEEALFRAVPIAGAALIGDRFGQRKLFIVIAFVVQAIIFGAGHAPYPNQPAYARPVELIMPSIGFGLLYLYFGLLPGIILHFAFDVVWFALPIFLAKAPGIWFQQLMVIVLTLVPLWIVLWRRMQAGRWTELSPIRSERGVDAAAGAADAPIEAPAAPHAGAARAARGRRGWRSARSSLVVARRGARAAQRRQPVRRAADRARRRRRPSRAQELQRRGVDAAAEVARDGGARRRQRRTAPVRATKPPAKRGGASCSASTCRSRAGACASRRSRGTSPTAPRNG